MKKATYLLFLIPFILAILATQGFGFIYKAAVTISCLIILFLAYGPHISRSKDTWYIILAFVLSIIGDAFLSNKGDSFLMFAVGIGFYFLAHAGYLVYALKNGSMNKIFTTIILIVYLVFFFFVLWPAINDPVLLTSVLLYLLISCLSVGASIDLKFASLIKWSYFTGIALILLSDTIISFKEFTTYQELNFLILPTYYAAHMLITFALVRQRD